MRKILNKLSILFVVFILIASPQAICDDIDYEALDVDSEVFTSSSRLEKNITEPDVNSRACVVIDKKTNTILYGKNEKQKRNDSRAQNTRTGDMFRCHRSQERQRRIYMSINGMFECSD